MNEVLRIIASRRSVRAFLPDQIGDAGLKAILSAGIYAPSGQNTQPWFFTVLQHPSAIAKVNDWILEEAKYVNEPKAREIASTPNAVLFRKAPTVVIVSGDSSVPTFREDCSCAGQNMMLAAESVGIGSCWISYVGFLGLRSEWEVRYRKGLRVPAGYLPLFGLTLGLRSGPAEPAHPRRKDVLAILK